MVYKYRMSISTGTKLTLDERNEYIIYIDEHMDEMPFNTKRDILTLLLNNIDDEVKIKHKGDGSLIRFDYISNDAIIWIYNRMYNLINTK